MPRAQPPAPLRPYCIRMTEDQIKALRLLGGPSWIREQVSKSVNKGSLVQIRNRRIRMDHLSGAKPAVLAKRYNVSKATVARVTAEDVQ